jgi:hypothetical protein
MSSNPNATSFPRRLPDLRTRLLIAGLAAVAFMLPGLSHAATSRHAIVLADNDATAAEIRTGYAARGFTIDRANPTKADVVGRAEEVAAAARELIASGIDSADITIVAAGDATSTALLASAVLGRLDVNYVLVGGCDAQLASNYRFRPSGRMLSLVQPGSDRSCRPQWTNAPRVSQRRELSVADAAGVWKHADAFNAMVQWSEGEYIEAQTKLIASATR